MEARDADTVNRGIVHHQHLHLLVRRQLFKHGLRFGGCLGTPRLVRHGHGLKYGKGGKPHDK